MNGCFVKLLAGAALSSVAMFGAQLTLQLNPTNPDPNGSNAPYSGIVSGIPSISGITVICDDDIDGASGTWNVNETSLAAIDGGSLSNLEFAGSGGTVNGKTYVAATKTTYQQAAYLAVEEMLYAANYSANSGIVDAIQVAIWDLFCSSGCAAAVTNSGYAGGVGGLGYTSYWDNQINGANWTKNQNLVIAMASEINFFTDTSHTPGSSDQEFILVTPEPATYALLGIGLVLLSLGTFRRHAKKSN